MNATSSPLPDGVVDTANMRTTAAGLIALISDPGSYTSWDKAIDIGSWPDDYQTALRLERHRAGTDEAVTTGEITIHRRPVGVIVSEFAFLGGSIGKSAADRIVTAIRTATSRGLPIVAMPSSGGTRMHEGTAAFLHVLDIMKALVAHRDARLPFLVYLRHPTMGGTLASWASFGHVVLAEPLASVGFLGDKVYRAIHGRPFPQGIQTSEHLARNAIVNLVVAPGDLRQTLDRVLRVVLDEPSPHPFARRAGRLRDDVAAWQSIQRTRETDRVSLNDLLTSADPDAVIIRPNASHDTDAAVVVALARWAGEPCVVVGQDRSAQETGTALGVAALKSARRGIALAADLRIPLVTVIDTPGAELSVRAEEGGLAREIARCIASMVSLSVPSVSVLLGQGCGAAALALFGADRVVATQSSWLSPLPLEGASAILFGDMAHAAQVAETQGIRAVDLYHRGVVHQVVPEYDSDSTEALSSAVVAGVAYELQQWQAAKR